MKLENLIYNEEDDIFLFYTESQIKLMAQRAIGRKLNSKELRYLKVKVIINIQNLIKKIASSGIGS